MGKSRGSRLLAGVVVLVTLTGCTTVAGQARPGPVPEQTDSESDGTWLFGTRIFDQEAVQDGVTTILTDAPPAGFGLTDVGAVDCPAGIEVIPGDTFTCSVDIDGLGKQVVITIKDDEGTYEVGFLQ